MSLSTPSKKELEELLAVPIAVSPDAPLAEAISLMNASATEAEKNDRSLAIENRERGSCILILKEGQLVGTFGEKDLIRVVLSDRDLKTTTIGEVMTRDPITINKSQLEDIFKVLNLFRQQDIYHLPVADELNQIVGLATPAFIDRVLQTENFLQLKTVEEAMERQILRVSPAASVREVVRLMAENRINCATIATTPVTVFTQKELLRCLNSGLNLAEVAVAEVAIAPVSVPSRASLWETKQLLLQNKVSCLTVITSGGKIMGTIDSRNILKIINPAAMYKTIRLLQGKVSKLEAEKMQVLERQKAELESQVQQRTRELQQQAKCDRLVAEVAAGIRISLDLKEILKTTVTKVRKFLQCDRAFIYCFDTGTSYSGVANAEDVKEGIQPLIGKRVGDPCFSQTWVEAYQNGRVRAVNDIYTSDITPCHLELLESLQIRAKILVPILLTKETEDGSNANDLWGFICVSEATAPREWDSVEVRLLENLSTQVAIAIQQSKLYELSQWEALVRTKAESILTQERNLLSAILRVAGALILVLSTEGRIIRFNKACEQITGYRFQEVFGHRLWDFLLAPEEIESVKAVLETLLTGYFPSQHEHHWVTKAGSRRLIRWSNTTFRDGDNCIKYIIATGIDISDRRRVETALERTESAYATLADSAPVGIFRNDVRGNCIYANDLACRLVGLLPHQLFHRGWTDKLHPEDRDRVLEEFDLAIENNSIFRSEYRFLHPNGNSIWVFGQCVPQLDDRGQIAGYTGTMMDITQRKRSELELQELNAELEKRVEERTVELRQKNEELKTEIIQRQKLQTALTDSQELLRDLFENVNDLVQSVSLENGQFLYVNRAWYETLGYEEKEIYNLSILDLIVPERQQDCREILSQFKAGELDRSEGLEIPFLSKDGRQIILEGNINCRYLDGKPVAIRGIFRDITARKQAEERLNDVLLELSYYKKALDRFALVATIDARGFITDANDKFCEVSQYRREELIGKSYYKVNSGYHSPKFFQEIWLTISGGKIWRGEIKNQKKDGSFYWLDNIIVPFLDEMGRPEQYLAIRIDISERKEAEEKLKQQLAAIEASGDGIAILKEDKYIYVNEAHAIIFGYENAAELIGKSWECIYTPAEFNRLKRDMIPMLKRQKYWRGEAIAQRKDGSHFVEELSLTLTEEETLICVCQDITERLTIQEKMRRRDAQFRAIFEQAAVGIARVSLEERFLQVNQRICQMLGYASEELLTKTVSEITHPEEWEEDREYLERILGKEIETFSREKRYLHKNGSVFWGKITASVVRGSATDKDYLIAVVEDISDRKKAEEEIRNALAREKELNELKSRFVSMTSHEFRTPLAVISSSAGIMKTFNKKLTDEKRLTHLNTIETYVKHTTRLLDDILFINKTEAGKTLFNPQLTNVVDFCANLIQEMQTTTFDCTLIFNNNCPPETKAKVDLKLLQQTLINLLSNAIKYSSEGGEVKLDLSMSECRLIFEVRDSGIGIPIEDQKHLFEPFHRATNAETIQGTGLGLVIIKKCVEMHGGEISFSSQVGLGTTFTVTIPLSINN